MRSAHWDVYKSERPYYRTGDTINPTGILKEYRWRLVAANGHIVISGEPYTNKANCKRAVRRIREIAADAPIARDAV